MSAAESSSEDENIEKLREAAAWSLETGAHHIHKDEEKKGKQSKRIDPSTHEQDGNELQTTPEFRAHVAKKLGAMLDSCISEMPYEIPQTSSSKSEECENRDDDDDDDEGFRLFSTSLPGKWWKEPSLPPPPKRPPAPSSSDSDSEMEMRLREAAVSISNLIPPSTEKNKEKERMSCRGNDEGIKEPKKKKKKKKNTAPPEERKGEQPLLKGKDEQRTHEQTVDENQVKKKKKKKRITEDEGGQ